MKASLQTYEAMRKLFQLLKSRLLILNEQTKGRKFQIQLYPKATVATTTCFLEEIQSPKTELLVLSFNPAW